MTEETKGNGHDKTADVVSIDRRATKEAPPPPPEQTPEEKERQLRENRIAIGRETGMSCLITTLRLGRTPAAREVIAGILDLHGRAEQTERLFTQAGESFNEIAAILGDILGYLFALEQRRKLRFWRRWAAPWPQFPQMKQPPDVPTAKPTAAPPPPTEATKTT